MTGRRSKAHRVSGTAKMAAIASGALFALSLIPRCMGFRYVGNFPEIPLFLLFLVSLVAVSVSACRRAGRRFLLRGLCALLSAAFVLLGGLVVWVYLAFGMTLSDTRVEASPSGAHRILIVDTGFIDSAYRAYPMVNAFLYRDVDSGWISYHDDWGGVGAPSVEWISETEARIWVPDTEGRISVGSTEEITVRFE